MFGTVGNFVTVVPEGSVGSVGIPGVDGTAAIGGSSGVAGRAGVGGSVGRDVPAREGVVAGVEGSPGVARPVSGNAGTDSGPICPSGNFVGGGIDRSTDGSDSSNWMMACVARSRASVSSARAMVVPMEIATVDRYDGFGERGFTEEIAVVISVIMLVASFAMVFACCTIS